ncbi:MAG: adenylate kinase [Gaiellaceae bacterium]
MRIVVKGASGSGKTTLARQVAARLGAPHVELDGLFHGPAWSEPTLEFFRARVAGATRGESWVADGNYDSRLEALVVGRADVVVWLDPPLRTIVARLARRTARRIVRREELWAGNRESLRGAFALFDWMLRSRRKQAREFPALPRLVRLRSPREVEAWLSSLGGAPP